MLSGKSTFFGVFSKVPEFLLVAFKLLEIYCAAFFSLFYASFLRKNVCKNPRFFSKTKHKTVKKNPAQCISSNLKATSKNSGTFENTQKKVDFPLSIAFLQALQLVPPTSIVTFKLVEYHFVIYDDFDHKCTYLAQ